MTNNSFKELQSRLEGKTILKIEEPNAPEAICKMILSDGSAFRLHATELGFWIEETADSNGYPSLTSLLQDYYLYVSHNKDFSSSCKEIPDIQYDKLYCKFIAPDSKEFLIKIKNLSNFEKKILCDIQGIEVLADAALLGNMWTLAFSKNNDDCPPELYMNNFVK